MSLALSRPRRKVWRACYSDCDDFECKPVSKVLSILMCGISVAHVAIVCVLHLFCTRKQ